MAEPEHPEPEAKLSAVTVAAPTASQQSATAERELALRLRLANMLHSTLDLNEVLRLFAAALERELAITGAAYRHETLGLSVEFATAARHRCAYQLDHEQTALGELEVSRAQRFNKKELVLLELMLGSLVPALRNALQYLGAMRSATRDALTGAGNRIALEIAADREIAMARRSGQPSAILVIDIDHFKGINDKYGHSAGDRVLVEVAGQLRHSCRETDSIFRFGGEEFVVLLSQTEENSAEVIAERIRSAIAAMHTLYQQQALRITASIGIACLNRGEALHAWFDRADRALYLAKQAGRNRVVRAAQRNIA
jgi:diguanylate cyclase (GGDEF)-like protein